jgi:threonine dehydrogenase-like Zn-dependent dehydrogenase
MKAFLVTRPGVGTIADVPPPEPTAGQVVVDVARVGICGTDVELFHFSKAQLRRLRNNHPLRLGHEWSGTVTAVGDGVDTTWLGRRVTGDTMLGCGNCDRCRDGRHYVCEERYEVGVAGGWPGALAEKLMVPVRSLHGLPDALTDEMGAMVEPGGNAYRAVSASGATRGSRVLVLGPGTIGLLAAQFALAAGSEVHVLGRRDTALKFARTLGVHGAWTQAQLPKLAWDAVIDATDGRSMPKFALDAVEPGRRVVFIGIADKPSLLDSRVFAYKDVTAVGILGGSLGLEPTIAAYESGAVDPTPLIAATVRLEEVGRCLDGWLPEDARSQGTKVLVDPTLG